MECERDSGSNEGYTVDEECPVGDGTLCPLSRQTGDKRHHVQVLSTIERRELAVEHMRGWL